jgi:hypothetical protein
MRTGKIMFALVFGLLVAFVVFAQNFKSRVLVEKESVKVVGAETFPKDLSCEIYIGPQMHPHFQTEGGNGQIKTATIDANLSTSVSLLRKDTEDEAYALYFFSEDKERKVFGLFDLNLDGQWDVKKSPTRKAVNFIFLRGEWFEVDKIEGLLSKTPSALRDGKQYKFDGSRWKAVE